MIIFIVGILSMVAVPKYNRSLPRQKAPPDLASLEYMRNLSQALRIHMQDHVQQGRDGVNSGDEAMKLLGKKIHMPEGMIYCDNVWSGEGSGMKWEFQAGGQGSAPRIICRKGKR